MLLGIILNFVRLFCGLLSCLMPFLSIIKSTLGKISFDYYLRYLIKYITKDWFYKGSNYS